MTDLLPNLHYTEVCYNQNRMHVKLYSSLKIFFFDRKTKNLHSMYYILLLAHAGDVSMLKIKYRNISSARITNADYITGLNAEPSISQRLPFPCNLRYCLDDNLVKSNDIILSKYPNNGLHMYVDYI